MLPITRKANAQNKKVPKDLGERMQNCEHSRYHTLDISHLNLDSIPPEVTTYTNVKVLNCGKNNFTKIPNIDQFRVIETLNLSRNMIYSMANINFTLFSDLKNIDLSRNQIEIIPAEISKLPFLEVLNLSYNKLTGVVATICEITSLKYVDLSHNNITVINEQFERLPVLETLNLTFNEGLDVSTLPTRTRRLVEKQYMLRSKAERRALVCRALGIRSSVLQHEQDAILQSWKTEEQDRREHSKVTDFP